MYKKYKKYSTSMKQKLGIIQVLMENPDFIILDEPFKEIERKTIIKISDILKKLKTENKLIVISTQSEEVITNIGIIADEIYKFDS